VTFSVIIGSIAAALMSVLGVGWIWSYVAFGIVAISAGGFLRHVVDEIPYDLATDERGIFLRVAEVTKAFTWDEVVGFTLRAGAFDLFSATGNKLVIGLTGYAPHQRAALRDLILERVPLIPIAGCNLQAPMLIRPGTSVIQLANSDRVTQSTLSEQDRTDSTDADGINLRTSTMQ